jgi:glucan-binding YG repeat protein
MVFALVPTISFAYDNAPDQDESYVQEDADFVGTSDTDEEEIYDPDTAVTEPPEYLEPAAEGDGWHQDAATGKWYYTYLGTRVTGKNRLGAGYYYFGLDESAFLQIGWIIETDSVTGASVKYYGDPTGTPDPSAPGSTYGLLKTGFFTHPDTGKKYYFEPTGACPCKMHTGWLKINNDKYYFKSSGVMQTGWLTLKGNKYYLDKKSGKMQTGYTKVGSDHYYFDTSNGKMKKNTAIKVNGNLRYFYSSGKAVKKKGWFTGSDKKKRYCVSTYGTVATGKKKIGSSYYLFDTSTGILKQKLGDTYDQRIMNMSSNTSYLVQVVKSKYQVRVYRGSKGNWSKVYTFRCAYGSKTPSTTTYIASKIARHNYTIGGKQLHYNYLSHINAGSAYMGFSGLVYDNTGKLYDGRLGGKYTAGNVRLSDSNALWIYRNVPNGTKVYLK